MATRRLPVHRIREVLRLRWRLDRSVRQTAAALGLSRSVVSKTEWQGTAILIAPGSAKVTAPGSAKVTAL